MFSKFLNLITEKQQRIINAAMKEFVQKGYEKASTNEIIKEAGISKGLLFHYFKNKKQLFLFLYDYCIDLCMNEFYKKIDLNEKDFFVRLRKIQLIKLELLNQFPEIFNFLQTAYMETSSHVKADLEAKNSELTASSTSMIFEDIDVSKFKEGLDIKKVFNIILWTFEGFSTELLQKAKLSSSNQIDYKKAFAEADVYIDMFKECFYK